MGRGRGGRRERRAATLLEIVRVRIKESSRKTEKEAP